MKTGPLSRHVLALYEAINHVNILCLFCLMLDQASSHRISVPHAGLKLLGWTTLDPQLVPRYFKKTCCLLFTMSCRGQHVHITTLQNIHRVSAHPSSHGANCTVWTNGWTNAGSDGSRSSFWTHSSVLSDAIRTPLSEKGAFEEKKPFAFWQCVGKFSQENMSPNWAMHSQVRNWVLTHTLMHAKN